MKNLSILYKITPVPAGKHSIRYAKRISFSRIVYTRNKTEAKRVSLFYAIVYSMVFGLSIAHYNEKEESDALPLTSVRFIAKPEKHNN